MNALSDIEEMSETRTGDGVSAISNSFRMELGQTQHSSFTVNSDGTPNRTSKSAGSVVFSVDPSVLHFIAGDDDSENSEEGHRDPFFGACCDLIRACIAVDAFYIIKTVGVLTSILLGLSVTDPDDLNLREYDDDRISEAVNQLDFKFWMLIAKNLCGLFVASISIYGATRFYKYPALFAAIWCGIDLVWSLMFERWIAAVIDPFCIYPHVALFLAIRNGRITRENYDSIKHCCCDCCETKCCLPREDSRGGSRQSTGTATAGSDTVNDAVTERSIADKTSGSRSRTFKVSNHNGISDDAVDPEARYVTARSA